MNDFVMNHGVGCIINGPAGLGKTHKLVGWLIKEDNPLFYHLLIKLFRMLKKGV